MTAADLTPEELRGTREALGLDPGAMGRALGAAPSSVRRWEYGQGGPSLTVRRLYAALRDGGLAPDPSSFDAKTGKARRRQKRRTPSGGNGLAPDELRALRRDLGLTEDGLAEWMGVSRGTVVNWENGKYPLGRPACRLYAALRDGEIVPARPPQRRTAELEPIPPGELRAIREGLGLTYAGLAGVLEAQSVNVGQWERGVCAPSGPVRRLYAALRAGEIAPAARRPERLSPADLKAIREGLGLPRDALGGEMGFTGETIAAWERGLRAPRGPACRLYAALRDGEIVPARPPQRRTAELEPIPADELRAIRDRLRLTQVALAAAMGVRTNDISRWEAGTSPPRGPALRLYAALRDGDMKIVEEG